MDRVRRSAMTLSVAIRAQRQSRAFVMCMALLRAMMIARPVWSLRQVCGGMLRLRFRSARVAVARSAHMAITPQTEKGVGERKSRASITSGGLVIQRPAT